MKRALIVNPKAGGGRAGRLWRRFEIQTETRVTSHAGEAAAFAREFADSGYDPVVVAGGDGTVSEAVNGILSSGARPALGILPCGSAGDFARSLGITRENAAAVIRTGRTRPIDAALISAQSGLPRWFVNVASAGLGGEVVRRPAGGYLLAALRTLATRGPWEIAIDGESQTLIHIAIGNTPWQGGRMHVCPGADPADGLLDITTIAPLGLFELARDLRLLYNGEIYRHPKVRHRRAARVRLASPGPVLYEADGEPAGELPIEISVQPGAVVVIVP